MNQRAGALRWWGRAVVEGEDDGKKTEQDQGENLFILFYSSLYAQSSSHGNGGGEVVQFWYGGINSWLGLGAVGAEWWAYLIAIR